MVVPFPPGRPAIFWAYGGTETGRSLPASRLVIDNRPGAGGLIGSQIVARQRPTATPVAIIGQPHLSNVLIREQSRSDPLKDFTAVTLVAALPRGGDRQRRAGEERQRLIALAKAKPGALNFGSAGVGSSSHLAAAMFVSAAGIKAEHVPFKTLADIFSEMLAGRVHFLYFPAARGDADAERRQAQGNRGGHAQTLGCAARCADDRRVRIPAVPVPSRGLASSRRPACPSVSSPSSMATS